MSDSVEEQLVLSDEAGNYYLIPRATVEQGRVPEEQKAIIDEALGGEDVRGFSTVLEERPASLPTIRTGLLGGFAVRGIIING